MLIDQGGKEKKEKGEEREEGKERVIMFYAKKFKSSTLLSVEHL